MLSNTALARLAIGLAEPNSATEIANLLNNPLNDSGNTVFTGTGAVTMAAGQKVVVVNKASGAATAVTLPPSPVVWQVATVKDGKGDAATNNITISPASGNVDGQASVTIKNNYGSMQFIYNGTQWNSINSDFWDGVSDLLVPGNLTVNGGINGPVAAAQNITANGQTITLPVSNSKLLTNNGAYTGIILTAGTVDGQQLTLINNTANSVTFAASGTSNVADGVSAVIAANRAMYFEWSATAALWFHS
jgi:hypothetical protein